MEEVTHVSVNVFDQIINSKTQKSEPVFYYTLKSSALIVRVISYGATVTSIETADKNDDYKDIVLGFDNVRGYESAANPYFGAVVGRYANRISNGCFHLDGKVYNLAKNAGTSHLHGGNIGFNKVNWHSYFENGRVVFTYLSEDEEEGYPGDLLTTVTYEIVQENRLKVTFDAVCTQMTVVNLTNHSYFNLAGHDCGSEELYDHIISINADKITVLDENMTATGELKYVGDTEYDLRIPKNMGKGIHGLKECGYDFNYCINRPDGDKKSVIFAARVVEPKSGRYLEVHTDQPGLQFYTSNALTDGQGKRGAKFGKHSAFCLETQNFPNAVNIDTFPSSILKPGERYSHIVWYTFGVTSSAS